MRGSSLFLFSSIRRHTRFDCDWSSDVCSSDLRGDVLARTCGADAEAPAHVGQGLRVVEQVSAGVPGPLPELSRARSEEHTSELQSQSNLVCRLLLEKKTTTSTSSISL